MGRGSNTNHHGAAGAALRPGADSGEIAFLDADRLDDYPDIAARSQPADDYGDDGDARAIASLARHLRAKGLSSAEARERAEDAYVKMIQLYDRGQLVGEAFERFAALCGERPDELRARLDG
jgi:hypothetical protein